MYLDTEVIEQVQTIYEQDAVKLVRLILRLHDQANIKQPSSKCIQNTRARRVL